MGLPGAGKSTLFAAVAGRQRNERGRGAATAVVRVPDARVERLAALFAPQKTTWAEIVFLGPATEHGNEPARGALPESMLALVRDVDVLAFVVATWGNGATASPAEALARLEDELLLRDLEQVETRLQRLQRAGKKDPDQVERALLEQLRAVLEAEQPLREATWSDEQLWRMRGFQFFSLKPALVVLNVGEDGLGVAPAGVEVRPGRLALALSALLEREVATEIAPGEQRQYLGQFGLERPARDVFVQNAYRLLDLVSFFTVGEDEVRAWPVQRGSSAPEAAGKIHSDLQKGFIRAEVIHYDEFLRAGNLAAARAQGLLRLEGKSYIVQDGDIMHVRHA